MLQNFYSCLFKVLPLHSRNSWWCAWAFIKKRKESWKSTSSTRAGFQSWSHPEDFAKVLCLEHELTSHYSCKVLRATSITTASTLSCSSLSSTARSSFSIFHNPLSNVRAGATPGAPAALVPILWSQTVPFSSTSGSPSSPYVCRATSSPSHAVSTPTSPSLLISCLFVAASEVLLPNWAAHLWNDRRSGNHSIAEDLRSLSSL